MANDLPLTISMGPLPPNIAWTPQEFADAIAARLIIQTQATLSLFVSGSTEPTSNVGPWLKDGETWYVWDNGTGGYVPQILPSQSLRYIIGESAPDPDDYNFWIQTTAALEPESIRTWYNGAWTDVYGVTIGDYYTKSEADALFLTIASAASTYLTQADAAANYLSIVNAASTYLTIANAASTYLTQANATSTYLTQASFTSTIANYSTTSQMNAAITAAAFPSYPAQGVVNNQAVPIDGLSNFTKLVFNSAPINPAPAPFDTGLNRYVAPATGNYMVAFSCQADKTAGAVAATMSVLAALYKNGSFVGNLMADLDNTPSPNGDRWSPGFSGMVACATNDYLEIFMAAEDGTNVDSLTTSAQFSIWRVSA